MVVCSYAAFWFGLVVVAALALDQGDPFRLIYGSDSFGNSCGTSNKNKYDNINSGKFAGPLAV